MNLEISTKPDGRGVLRIDGVDLSNVVSGFTVECTAGLGTHVSVRLREGLNMALTSKDPAIQMVRATLIKQQDCTCAEILPTFEHSERLEIDPACPVHGVKP